MAQGNEAFVVVTGISGSPAQVAASYEAVAPDNSVLVANAAVSVAVNNGDTSHDVQDALATAVRTHALNDHGVTVDRVEFLNG